MSNIINKAKEAVHDITHKKDHDAHHNTATHTTTTGTGVGTGAGTGVGTTSHAGVTSTHGHNTHGTHTTHTAPGTTGVAGTTGSTTAGPHSSNLLNKADPSVDSDLDGSRNAGLAQNHGHNAAVTGTGAGVGTTGVAGTHNTRGTHGTHTTHTTHTAPGTTGVAGTNGSTNAGPHSSNLLNKADPRVDSNLDGSRNAGLAQNTHHAGGHPVAGGVHNTHGSTNAGPYKSNLANAADPRVDSDLDGSRNAGLNQTTYTSGTGVGAGVGTGATGVGAHGTTTGTHGTHGTTTAGPGTTSVKPTLGQRLNPKIDADGDGKAGILD